MIVALFHIKKEGNEKVAFNDLYAPYLFSNHLMFIDNIPKQFFKFINKL